MNKKTKKILLFFLIIILLVSVSFVILYKKDNNNIFVNLEKQIIKYNEFDDTLQKSEDLIVKNNKQEKNLENFYIKDNYLYKGNEKFINKDLIDLINENGFINKVDNSKIEIVHDFVSQNKMYVFFEYFGTCESGCIKNGYYLIVDLKNGQIEKWLDETIPRIKNINFYSDLSKGIYSEIVSSGSQPTLRSVKKDFINSYMIESVNLYLYDFINLNKKFLYSVPAENYFFDYSRDFDNYIFPTDSIEWLNENEIKLVFLEKDNNNFVFKSKDEKYIKTDKSIIIKLYE